MTPSTYAPLLPLLADIGSPDEPIQAQEASILGEAADDSGYIDLFPDSTGYQESGKESRKSLSILDTSECEELLEKDAIAGVSGIKSLEQILPTASARLPFLPTLTYIHARIAALLALCCLVMVIISPLYNLGGAMHLAFGGGQLDGCDDPWTQEGYIWYGPNLHDVRYIPYKRVHPLVNATDLDTLSPESHFATSHENSLPANLAAPLQLSEMFRNRKSLQKDTASLEFLRNRHIVALGSSLDRHAVMDFCATHGARLERHSRNRWAYCHFPDYNLTVSQWMVFGLSQTTLLNGGDDPRSGTTVEDRVTKAFSPLVEKYGRPDLLIFSTGFWDLLYLHLASRKNNPTMPKEDFEHLTWDQLAWHRARLSQVFSFLRSTFPETVLMYRTTTETRARRSDADNEPISVFQLNQSARLLMAYLKIPIFNWSELVRGNNEHTDVLHFVQDSRPNWIYGEMLLWHLKQVVERPKSPACWLNR